MRPPSVSELLDAWEQGLDQSPVERSLTLLAPACPGTPRGVLERLSIGQRDARLLTLREWSFGPRMTGLAACPACGERLEFTCSTRELRAAPPDAPAESLEADASPPEASTLHIEGYELRFRLPNTLDLGAMETRSDRPVDISATHGGLLSRCLLAASHRGEDVAADRLPPHVVDAVVEHMARSDPQADVQLALSCPHCGHEWQVPFDIALFLWTEVDAWARRLLDEVHQLASAYGWRERDILAMSPQRRQAYLERTAG